MKVREEINKFASEEDKPVLLWLLDKFHMASEWGVKLFCTFLKYGNYSYQSNRVWHPTATGLSIYKSETGHSETEVDRVRSLLHTVENVADGYKTECERLMAREVKLMNALKQYADDSNWCYDTCEIGRGIAQDAIRELELS